MKPLAIAGSIITVGGAVGVIFTAWNATPVPNSVKEYHIKSMAPVQKSLENVETNAVVDRIMRIQEDRCENDNLMRIIEEQRTRYKELTDREFGLPPCP